MLKAIGVRFALLLIVLSPVSAFAQALADRVPADTTIYVGFTGVDASVPGFKGSNFETVLNNSNMRAVVDDFLPKVFDRVAKEDKDVAEVVEIVRSVAGPMSRHPFALAFVGVEMNQQTGPRPKLVLLSQPGADLPALKAKINDLLKQAGQPPFPVNLIESGNVLALVVGYDKPETAIPAAGAESLATSPGFVKSLAQVGKNGFGTLYLDFDKLLSLVDFGMGMAPPEIKTNWEKARDTIGLKGIHHIIMTSGYEGKEWGVQAFVDAPAPRPGYLSGLMEGGVLSKNIIDTIPATASNAAAGKFNLDGFVEMIHTAAGMIDPNAGKEFDQGLSQINQAIGFDLRKDLLSNFGDEWAVYSDPSIAGSGIVSMTVTNHLKDGAKAEAALSKLEDFANRTIADEFKNEKDGPKISVKRINWGGIPVHYVGLPFFAPAWTIHNGNFYFAFYPETVVAAARRTPGKDKSIADNPAFAVLMKKLGDHAGSSFQFADLPRLVPQNYSTWLVVSRGTGIADLFGVPAPLQIIPPLQNLMPVLSASGATSWTDAAGAHFHAITPFPGADVLGADPMSMSAAQAPLLISILLPALNKVRGEALKAKSASNLKNIAAGAITYANVHNGKYPKTMGELCESSGMTVAVFVNPASNTTPVFDLKGEELRDWVNQKGDYVWNGANLDSTAGADVPLAWEKPLPGQQGMNILFGDYHVQWFFQSEGMDVIAKAKPSAKGL